MYLTDLVTRIELKVFMPRKPDSSHTNLGCGVGEVGLILQ